MINQILNINDSDSENINQILTNYNVSKDEILRRIAQSQTSTTYNSRTTTTEKSEIKDETKEHPNSEPTRTEAEKAE